MKFLPGGALAVILAVGIHANPAPAQSPETWPIKEFQVVAVEPAGAVEDDDGIFGRSVEEMVRTIRTETNFDPDFPSIWEAPAVSSPAIESAKTEIERVLREAASRLEAWGFPAPALEPVVTNESGEAAYRVYLVADPEAAPGEYHTEPCGQGLREAVLVLGAENALDDGGSLTRAGAIAAIHELVHAVQYPLAAFSCGRGRPGQWVSEGTPHAVALDIARQLPLWDDEPLGDGWWKPWGGRTYSEQLPVAGATGSLQAYMTLSFWRFLAEYRRSRPSFPGPDLSPVDYGYLPPLLDRPLSPRDCYRAGAPCDAELRWVDAGLEEFFGASLRQLYPRFLQAYVHYGDGRARRGPGGAPADSRARWLDLSFSHDGGSGCRKVRLRPNSDERQQRYVVSRFRDVAAQCWEVDLEEFEGQVVLAVTASHHRPNTEAIVGQLTAVMADASERIDRAEVRTVAAIPEATWYYDHVGNEEDPLFLLTNVADQPDATRPIDNLTVVFTAVHEYVDMGVGGDSDGPTPADIARPIDFDVAEGDFTVLYVKPDDAVVDDLDIDHPMCTVWVKLRSEQEDALWVTGNLSSPIRPGTYPIVETSGGSPDLLGSRFWTNRTAGRGRLQLFGRSGELEIASVDHLMIEGSVRTHVHKGLEGGDVNLLVQAEFGLQPGSMVSGILGPKAADHPCFLEEAPREVRGPGGDLDRGRSRSGGEDANRRNAGADDGDATGEAGSGQSDGVRSGGLPEDGRGGDDGTPAAPGAAPRPDPDAAPSDQDSLGDINGAADAALSLEFVHGEGVEIRAGPQAVRSGRAPEALSVSSPSYGLQLALHQDRVWQCAESGAPLGGIYALVGLAMEASAAADWDGWYRIDIGDAEVELEAGADGARLDVEFDRCEPGTNRCQAGVLAVRSEPSQTRLTSAADGSTRLEVSGGSLEADLGGQAGTCDGLIDFSARVVPSS